MGVSWFVCRAKSDPEPKWKAEAVRLSALRFGPMPGKGLCEVQCEFTIDGLNDAFSVWLHLDEKTGLPRWRRLHYRYKDHEANAVEKYGEIVLTP